MTHQTTARRKAPVQILAVAVAALFVIADVAAAGNGDDAASTRSRGGSSSGSSSASSSSSSSGSSASSSRAAVSRAPGSSSTSRSAVPGTSARGREGAARTRTRHDRDRHHGRGGVSIGYGSSFFWHPYWGYWGWGYGWGPGYGYGYYPPVTYSRTRGYRMGALDIHADPKRTEIYVDGQYVGLAKQYDGFPGHLWLESGVYEISFYKPGYETQTRTVKVLTDLVLEMDVQMQPGQAERPEERFGPPSEMDDADVDEIGAVYERRPERGDHQARLHVRVEPGNALIYLDGNVLGTADELAGLHAGLLLRPGSHRIEVVRRGFETAERRLDVAPGEELELVVALRPLAEASP